MRDLLKHNFRFRLSAILVLGQALVLLVISFFHIGGDNFVAFMFSALAPIYALIATMTVYVGWKSSYTEEVSRRIWGWMFLGLGLWTIAEGLYFYYTIAYQVETPFPSPADFLWVVGTFPLFLAFIIRYQSFKVELNQRQMLILAITNLIFLIFIAIFILPQIFGNANPSRWLETAINLFYTLTDLLMFALSLGIILNLHRGQLATVWVIILWSNIVRSIADTAFAYFTWNQATLSPIVNYTINYLYNIPYLTAYLLIALGMLVYRILVLEKLEDEAAASDWKDPTYSLALIFTNAQNNIITTSDNISGLTFGLSSPALAGQPLHTALGLDPQVVTKLVNEFRQKGYISSYPVEIRIPKLGQFEVWLTATRDANAAISFNGLNILLRVKDTDIRLESMSPEFKSISKGILADTGQASSENINLLIKYFNAQVYGLYKLVETLAGSPAAQFMIDNFNQTSAFNRWNIKMNQQEIVVLGDYGEKELGKAFILLFKNVTGYAVDMTSAQVVADEIRKTERGLDSKTIKIADELGLRGRKLSFRNIEVDYKAR